MAGAARAHQNIVANKFLHVVRPCRTRRDADAGLRLRLRWSSCDAGGALSESFVAGDLTSFLNTSDGTPCLFRGTFGGVDPGLSIFSYTDDDSSDFTAGVQAFSGSATWLVPDNDEFADLLAGNTSGDIYIPADTLDDISGLAPIGTWVVVPEPTTCALLAIAIVGLVGLRRSS